MELTCPKCGNKGFEFSVEFNFDSNYIEPTCTKCRFGITKAEYIRQTQEVANAAIIQAMKNAGFSQK